MFVVISGFWVWEYVGEKDLNVDIEHQIELIGRKKYRYVSSYIKVFCEGCRIWVNRALQQQKSTMWKCPKVDKRKQNNQANP